MLGLIGAAALAAGLVAAPSAFGVAQTIVANDNFFSAAVYTMDQGDRPVLQNAGSNPHNATATANGPDRQRLFESPTIGTGTTQLNGTQYLTAGSYAFICTVHPDMVATLAVSGAGTPVARPKVKLKVLTKKLAKVAGKGKLPVQVNAVTASENVELEAKLGKRTLGTVSGISLAAGAKRTAVIKSAKKIRKVLRKKNKATVRVEATVPFGSPAGAKRKLK